MNLEREIEFFLEWLKKEYPMMHQWYLEGDDDWKTNVDYMFVTWIASASRDGYKLVPMEPTWEMIDAGENSCYGDDEDIVKKVYKAMLGAVDET